MMVKAYAIYDAKISQYRIAIFDIEDGGAMRQFSDAVNDEKSPWNKHPEDYSLWYIGSFDGNKGELIPDKLVNLVNATAVLSLKEKQLDLPAI